MSLTARFMSGTRLEHGLRVADNEHCMTSSRYQLLRGRQAGDQKAEPVNVSLGDEPFVALSSSICEPVSFHGPMTVYTDWAENGVIS